ncbi:phage virion morphogenesis protein [Methylobacter sp. Wu8]|uniref:phage virion morphogenesis protein n=1 Tax=Methylobacter sp. Wu8 TaxID=3118457 RepID=UPI002F3356E7
MKQVLKLDVVGILPFERQMKLLQLSPDRRRRLVSRVTKKVIKDSNKRVRNQVDLQGNRYQDRHRKRTHDRRKMLSRLVKELKVIQADSNSATAGFNSPVAGRIAADQQYGKRTTVSAASFGGRSAESYNKPATQKQARALIEAGFKLRINGKGRKSPSMKYIKEHYTQGQAGTALKRLRAWAGVATKTSWSTVLPARSFLGATAAEIQQYIEQIYDDMEQEMKRGIR